MFSGLPVGSYSVVCTDGTYFYSTDNVAISGPTLAAPAVTEVSGTGQTYSPKDGDPLWVSMAPNSALMAFVYDNGAFQSIQYSPGADPDSCKCVSDSRKGTYELPYQLSCATDQKNTFAFQAPTFTEPFGPNSGLNVRPTTPPHTRWLIAATYSIAGWSDLGSTCNPSGGGPDASGMISLGAPGNVGGLNISVTNNVAIPWYQVQLYFSLGDGVWWLVGAYQPNRRCRTTGKNPCSQLLSLDTSQYGFTWVPQQNFAGGYYAPISTTTVTAAQYSSSGPPAVAYTRSYTGDFAANFGPHGPYAPLPVSVTAAGAFDPDNQMYNPALPCFSGQDAVAIWELTGSAADQVCYFSYRWGCLGTQCLIVALTYSAPNATLQLIDEYGSSTVVNLVDVDDSPAYGWLYMTYNHTSDEYWVSAGLSANRLVSQPQAFASASNWLVISSRTSTNYSAVKSAVASVWPGLQALGYSLPASAPGLLLSLGAVSGGLGVSNYTTLTAAQALCQFTSGGTVGMLVPVTSSLGFGAGIDAPGAACDSLMQGLCAGQGVDPVTCCVFRSSLSVPGFSAQKDAQFAACYNNQCSGNAQAGSSLPPLGLSYQPSTTTSCGSFCGNIQDVQGNSNDINHNNQTVYCSSPGVSMTWIYILLALILAVVGWSALSQ
jgi:hypothetical protein